jgi:hypothetical protein
MTIYLACTVRGDRGGLAAARRIAGRLRALGHEILTGHLLADDVETTEAALSEQQVYERDRAWLDACEALVVEASGSSYGVGFEVGYVTGRASETGQRVLVLYDAARRAALSRLVTGYTGPGGVAVGYENLDDLARIIDREFAARRIDTRIERRD